MHELAATRRARGPGYLLVQAILARGAAPNVLGDDEDKMQLARQALVQLGFLSVVATAAVDKACARVGGQVELADLINEALRWCQ